MRRVLLLIPLALLGVGCDKVVGSAKADEEPPKVASSAAAPAKSAAPAVSAKPVEDAPPGARYGVPFAWEVSKDEPVAKARAYLSEMLADNAANVALGKTHFTPFAEEQNPRATVVTCADSRVQASAWDRTPENDAFTIRNIGNQLERAEGSVAYGLEHLHTPVLLILGHTGCGAVKAAMGKLDDLEPPIKAELKGLKLPPPDPKANERQAWAQAVVANVNAQVEYAVDHFSGLLREQRVLVVGAVYDLRNDLGRGYGRVSVVNVNGNTEAKRLRAFEAALVIAPQPDADEEPAGLARGKSGDSTLSELLRRQADKPGLEAEKPAVAAALQQPPRAKGEEPRAKDAHEKPPERVARAGETAEKSR